MPELPEVEVILQEISNNFLGETISHIIVRCPKLREPISEEIYKIKNQIILSIKRKGKYLIIKINNGYILIHFGMSGNFLIFSKKSFFPLKKHDHIDFIINNKILRYNDPRRFGLCLWTKNLNNKFLNNIGLDPFDKNFNGNYLFIKSRKIKKTIKTLIMQGRLVSGIGNIYANEALFASRILPNRKAMSLTKKESIALVFNIKNILLKAIKKGGTTIRDFHKTDGTQGGFNNELKIYNKFKKPCVNCGNIIQCIKQENRKTYLCIHCQK